MPVTTLSTGITVGNFCSEHSYVFDDGSILPACSAQRRMYVKLRATFAPHPSMPGTVEVTSCIPTALIGALKAASHIVDVILVSNVVADVLKDYISTNYRRDAEKRLIRTIYLSKVRLAYRTQTENPNDFVFSSKLFVIKKLTVGSSIISDAHREAGRLRKAGQQSIADNEPVPDSAEDSYPRAAMHG